VGWGTLLFVLATKAGSGFLSSREKADKLRIVADAGHAVHLEKPEETLALVRSFLAA
jgi:pimeloyl-ACP methyl ester carboxylesterase